MLGKLPLDHEKNYCHMFWVPRVSVPKFALKLAFFQQHPANGQSWPLTDVTTAHSHLNTWTAPTSHFCRAQSMVS